MTGISTSPRWMKLQNEAAVELKIVIPLVSSLGYEPEDIAPKYPVMFQEGRRGRKNEADFVLFSGPLHDRDTSLVVIEAKGPSQPINGSAKAQAESYAFATRAPIVLMCSDHEIEVWQVNSAFESQCVLSIKVDEIEARRGEIERILHKDAVVDYCRKVALKPLDEVLNDFVEYYNAELRRTIDAVDHIERRLSRRSEREELSTRDLSEICPSGALVAAASGYGKSILSTMLVRQAITKRSLNAFAPLAVHVSLPDVESSQALADFVRDRIAAYKPGFTGAVLKEHLRRQGLLLACDGFDRLSPACRESRGIEFRNLIRDYPKLQLFIFSRPSALPDIKLERLDLEPLDQNEIGEILSRRVPEAQYSVLGTIPSTLYQLCKNPLILARTIYVWRDKGSFPRRIEDLFDAWLDQTLALSPQQVVKTAERQEALEIIADCADGGRIAVNEALKALKQAQLKQEILDDLVGSGALLPEGSGVVRFEHEALGDFLKARRLARLDLDVLLPRLHDIVLQPGSFFPVLLMALLKNPQSHAMLWHRLSGLDLELYMEVLRYRADLSPDNPSPEDGERFLRETLDGLELPLDGFFPRMRGLVERMLTGQNKGLSLVGLAGPGSVVYSFECAQQGIRVFNRMPDRNGGKSIVNLGPSGLRLDSGRLLGLRILRDQLIGAVEGRLLGGGPIWRRERLIGWLSGLSKSYGLHLGEDSDLARWVEWADPHRGKTAVINNRQPVPIDDLLADLRALQDSGTTHLDRGARPSDWIFADGEILVGALEDHFTVKQLIYRELVESNFQSLGGEIGKYAFLPVRWEVHLMRGGSRGPVIDYRWSPVNDWAEAGADIVEGEPSSPDLAHYEEVTKRLAELGRSRRRASIYVGSAAVRSMRGASGESSAVTSVSSDLKRDIEALFEAMPSNDETPNWD